MGGCLRICNCRFIQPEVGEHSQAVHPSEDIYHCGLSISGLKRIFELNIPEGGMSGRLVVERIVKPQTEVKKCSYVEHLYENQSWRGAIGKCTTFLSHPWSANFKDTLAALRDYEDKLPSNTPKQFYFVDYFAINQHDAQDDLENLAEVVQKCKSLVLMAQPWEKPVSLTRIWCIFELAHAVIGKNEIILILPPEEEKRFQMKMRENVKTVWTFLDQLFSNIDSGSAEATVESDVRKIRVFMQKVLGGFDKVDTMVADALRAWFLQSVKTLVPRFPEAERGSLGHASLLYDVASFYSSQAQWNEALSLYKEAKDVYIENRETSKWLACEYNEIRMVARMGLLTEALESCIQHVSRCCEKLGKKHDQTLDSMKLLGDTYRELGELPKSEEILREVLDAYKETKPRMDYHIIRSMVALAETLRDSCNWDGAKNILHDVIKSRIENFGSENTVTLNSVTKYARVLALSGKPEKAIPLFKAVIPEIRMKYGADDIYVKNSEEWLREAKKSIQLHGKVIQGLPDEELAKLFDEIESGDWKTVKPA